MSTKPWKLKIGRELMRKWTRKSNSLKIKKRAAKDALREERERIDALEQEQQLQRERATLTANSPTFEPRSEHGGGGEPRENLVEEEVRDHVHEEEARVEQ